MALLIRAPSLVGCVIAAARHSFGPVRASGAEIDKFARFGLTKYNFFIGEVVAPREADLDRPGLK